MNGSIPPALGRKLGALKLASAAGAKTEVGALKLKNSELGPSLDAVHRTSERKALLFARGVIANWTTENRAIDEAAAMMNWAAKAKPGARRTLVRAFTQSGNGLRVVHNVGEMSQANARSLMKDFFDEGGKLDDVAEWMARAGEVLLAETLTSPQNDFFNKAASWFKKAIKTVADAVRAAGKSLSKAMKAVANWSAKKVAGFVRALIEDGQTVGNILREAIKQGSAALKKFIRGVLDAGRKVGEVLVAFVKDQLSTIRMVLDALLQVGTQLGTAITAIVTDIAAEFRKGFFEGLIALGKAPSLIMKEALKASAAVAVLAFAVLLDVLGGHRSLSKEEERQARRVFGYSIELGRVKVAVGSIPADLINLVNGGRPFTTMYVINFASWDKFDMKTLIHELAHVWQGVVAGPIYAVEALHAQAKYGRDAYKVTDAMLRQNGNQLSNFNREQQAVIAEEYWYEKWGKAEYPRLNGRDLNVVLLEPYAKQMYKPRAVVPDLLHPHTVPVVFQPRIKPAHRIVGGRYVLAGRS